MGKENIEKSENQIVLELIENQIKRFKDEIQILEGCINVLEGERFKHRVKEYENK